MKLKKWFSLILVVAVFMSMSVPAFAAVERLDRAFGTIAVRWINIDKCIADISSVGATVYYNASIKATSVSANITGTMYLQKYSAGAWSVVASSEISGTGSVNVEKSYNGTNGAQYRTKVVVNVAGESATAYSNNYIL